MTKEEIEKVLLSIADDNSNWYKSRAGEYIFDVGTAIPLMAEAIAKIIVSQPVVSFNEGLQSENKKVPEVAVLPIGNTLEEEAWKKLKEKLGTKGWTAGEHGTFYGFFLHGWRMKGKTGN